MNRILLPKRIPELDGFRAIAVLMVMAEHMYDGWRLPPIGMPRVLHFIITHGWLGVDLFFILSGFLITGILLDERSEPGYFKTFYRRRSLRILPLALTCIAIYWLFYSSHYERYFLLALLFSANLNILLGVPGPHGPGVMWSLAVEEHFYLLWPLAVRRLTVRHLAYAAGAIVLLSPVIRGIAMHYGADSNNVYQLSWFRFDGLALGALLAIFVRSPFFTRRNTWLAVSGWILIVGAVTIVLQPYGASLPQSVMGEAIRYTQAQALFAGAMILCLAYQGSTRISVLRSSAAAYVAKLSYCLYLIHLSIGDLYYWTLHHFGVDDIATFGALGALLMRYAIIIPISFALAILSQKYLESPFLRMRHASIPRPQRDVRPDVSSI